jgi:hypothetical protein
MTWGVLCHAALGCNLFGGHTGQVRDLAIPCSLEAVLDRQVQGWRDLAIPCSLEAVLDCQVRRGGIWRSLIAWSCAGPTHLLEATAVPERGDWERVQPLQKSLPDVIDWDDTGFFGVVKSCA